MTKTVTFQYSAGAPVLLTDLERPATVTGMMVDSDGGLMYRVLWWGEGQRHCEWLYDYEIKPREIA